MCVYKYLVILITCKSRNSIIHFHSNSLKFLSLSLSLSLSSLALIPYTQFCANQVWQNLVPAKAELLVWFLVQGRLNTKERLHRLQVLINNDTMCPICNLGVENLSHLFFSCEFAWDIWSRCCQQWGLSWVVANCPRKNFEECFGAALTGQRKKLWTSCF